jgi:hypothetical protein
MKKAPKKPITCHNPTCHYTWNTASRKRYVSCPECLYKVKNPYYETEEINLVHFNLDNEGVRILDPSLATRYSPHGRIIDVYFKDGKAYCGLDDSQDCKHVKYALSLPLVQRILKKRGWKIK